LFQRYFVEPYRFIPPYRKTLWCRLARHVIPGYLGRKLGVPRWHFQGLDYLRDSLAQDAGILLTPNHCRWADPCVMGMLGLEVQRYFYYMVSYHLFKQSRLMGWYMNRIGGYSILREGTDREAIRATAHILAQAERPVVLFPEGTWFRQNDYVGPLQDGVTLIARQAARHSERPLRIHPVGIKYWALSDPRPELLSRLDGMERALGWHPQNHLDFEARLEKLGRALISLKEIEQFGEVKGGVLDERIQQLAASHVTSLEKRHLGREFDGWTLERIRRLRQGLVRQLHEAADGPAEVVQTRQDLDTLLFCENLSAHSLAYLRERPSLERLTESVQRIEETVTDQLEKPVTPLGATIAIGPAFDARSVLADKRTDGKGFMGDLRAAIQELLNKLLAEGPPLEWSCPPAIEGKTDKHPVHCPV
jgi:1-acyl-sn-glycerol-3-phosphate acyltransferase